MTWLQSGKARAFRRSKAIRGACGPNGTGKSTVAVWDLLPSLDAGRPVLSTARLLDYRNPRDCEETACEWPGHPYHGQAHPAWVPFTDWRQLIGGDGHPVFRDGDVFLDEIAGSASSRESGSLPFQVARDLQQLRKRNVTLTYTGPAFARVEKIIRETTQLITFCSGLLPVTVESSDTASAWKRNRLLRWRSFDASDVEKFTAKDAGDRDAQGRATLKPVVSQYFRVGDSDASRCFDTYDYVLSLGWANEAGMCLACGGRRAVPRCDCGTAARSLPPGVGAVGAPAPSDHAGVVSITGRHASGS